MSPRTAEKVKVLSKKKVSNMRKDTVFEDDYECMAYLSKMLKSMRKDENVEI
jgi:hypothetical protein